MFTLDHEYEDRMTGYHPKDPTAFARSRAASHVMCLPVNSGAVYESFAKALMTILMAGQFIAKPRQTPSAASQDA
ncbi:MAG: hypothetical protein ACT4OZ_12910 [Gemmatimonadota bacterium]